jgi:hypothetical protein
MHQLDSDRFYTPADGIVELEVARTLLNSDVTP